MSRCVCVFAYLTPVGFCLLWVGCWCGGQLNAQKKEIVDTDALIERYRKEIEDLKRRLAEREADAPVRSRRLSAREVGVV